MRTTGFGLSAFLIAVGAILKWAVSYDAEGVDVNQVGLILLVVGLGLGLVTLLMASVGRRTTVSTEVATDVQGQPVAGRQRDVIVERD